MEGQKTVGLNSNGTGFDGFARYAGPESFVKECLRLVFIGWLEGYGIWLTTKSSGRLKEKFQTA
ncbi:hypothetical protein HMPREF2865_06895 [Neisseria sp. HMSC073G10]|nr:hypothetical protein HMPREF2865_06895 [Neisseria sp. HMSC073G10]